MLNIVIKSDTGCRPPILSAPDDSAERADFLAYFDMHNTNTPIEAAQTEAQRLSYYFTALDKRLTRGGPVEKGGTPKSFSVTTFLTPPIFRDYKPRDVYRSGDLRDIFQNIAAQTRSMILSEVMICPASTVYDPELHMRPHVHLGGIETTFLYSQEVCRHAYNFGFFDVRHDSTPEDARWQKFSSDIAIPVLALDDDMLKTIQPYQPQKLLRPLQDIITLCNHDMMHNMVSVICQGDISRPREIHFKPEMRHFMEHKTGPYRPTDILGFESALIVGHARTWQDLKDTATGEKMSQAIDDFYDHLHFVAGEMEKDKSLSFANKHQTLDYFATVVPYALARLVQLHDPLIERSLQRAQDIDPAPKRTLAAARTTNNHQVSQILQNYRKAGTPLAADENTPSSYREAKKLQLVCMLPEITILLSPPRKGSPEYRAHLRSDEMDRDIVNIILGSRKNTPL